MKNFFSNGRRRLRRAAARLNDPERTRRENLRRKEKRKLAALAAAAAARENNNVTVPNVSSAETTSENSPVKDSAVLSPERRALMEKLADKVHRSAAQKSRVTLMNDSLVTLSNPYDESIPVYDSQLQQLTHATLQQPIYEISNNQLTADTLSPITYAEPFNNMILDTSTMKTFDNISKNEALSMSSLLDDPLTQLTCDPPYLLPPTDSLLSLQTDSPLSSPSWSSTLLS